MKTFSLSLLSILIIMSYATNAQAGYDIVHCGDPIKSTIETDPNYQYCDIYQRQLSYRGNAIDLREQIADRQESYAAPIRAAYTQYRKDLEALHDSIPNSTEDSD